MGFSASENSKKSAVNIKKTSTRTIPAKKEAQNHGFMRLSGLYKPYS